MEVLERPDGQHMRSQSDLVSAASATSSGSLNAEGVQPAPFRTFSDDFDHYGFKRTDKWLPLAEQLAWEADYEAVLLRRRARWEQLMSKSKNKLPERSPTVQRFVRKGIPRHLRALAWFKYSGAEDFLQRFPVLYDSLLVWAEEQQAGRDPTHSALRKSLEQAFESIEKDLTRTFPDNRYFRTEAQAGRASSTAHVSPDQPINIENNVWLASLRRILRAFAAFSSSREVESGLPACSYPIGYAQSLNYIAGLLLLVFARCYRTFPESETATVLLIGYFEQEDLALLPADAISRIERLVFATMCCMVDKLMPIGMYNDPDLAGGLLEQDVFWDGLLDGRAGQLGLSPYRTWWLAMEKGVVRKRIFSRKKGELEPFPGSLKIVTFAWMLTMFVDSMPVETTLRIWDTFFYEGFHVVHMVILAMFKIYQPHLIQMKNGSEAWTWIKQLPHSLIDCHTFLRIVFEPPRPIELKAQGSVSKLKPGYPLLYDGGGIGGTVDDSRLARLRRKLTKLRNKT